jgi:hypothetical protein
MKRTPKTPITTMNTDHGCHHNPPPRQYLSGPSENPLPRQQATAGMINGKPKEPIKPARTWADIANIDADKQAGFMTGTRATDRCRQCQDEWNNIYLGPKDSPKDPRYPRYHHILMIRDAKAPRTLDWE